MVEVLTEEQQKIQKEIDIINQKLNDLKKPIADETKAVIDNGALIIKYTEELKVLYAKLKNVTDTHTSQYDAIKNRITDIKKEIVTCNTLNKPKALGETLTKSGIESTLQSKLTSIKSDIAKLVTETDPYEIKTILFRADMIRLNREIESKNKEIIQLEKIKEKNVLQIEELNKIIKGLDKTIYELETKIYSNLVVSNENLLNVSEDIDISLNYLFSYLNKQGLSSDLIYEKIDNRDREHELLYNRNKMVDILFFCFYFSFLLIMICTQNIQREHFLIYLFVGLIPFIYPFVFKYVLYLIRYLSNDIHGPKNAFVDINNTLIAYNG